VETGGGGTKAGQFRTASMRRRSGGCLAKKKIQTSFTLDRGLPVCVLTQLPLSMGENAEEPEPRTSSALSPCTKSALRLGAREFLLWGWEKRRKKRPQKKKHHCKTENKGYQQLEEPVKLNVIELEATHDWNGEGARESGRKGGTTRLTGWGNAFWGWVFSQRGKIG